MNAFTLEVKGHKYCGQFVALDNVREDSIIFRHFLNYSVAGIRI